MICPLCDSSNWEQIHKVDKRRYLRCNRCHVIFTNPDSYMSPDEERAIYDYHENEIDDPGYRTFLSRLFKPMNQKLPSHCKGLDFGCGPGPALVAMFEEAGHEMEKHDLFYYPNQHVFDKAYDFIVSTETVEHLHQPKLELERLWNCLNIEGLFGVMTMRWDRFSDFSKWHYIKDPTHILFFSLATFKFMAEKWHAEIVYQEGDVVIFKKLRG